MANARNDNDQISRPLVLDRTPRTPEELIAMGAQKMSDYLDPESGVRDHEVVEFMLELFDNPTAIEALDREMERRARGRDVGGWH
jgi:hypothetical protein